MRPEKLTELCFDRQPPVVERDVNMGNPGGSRQTKTVDLRGMRVGRLLVIGYWGRRHDGRKEMPEARIERKKRGESFGLRSSNGRSDQLWVCRCLCGLFTIRTAKALMKIKPPEVADLMRCEACCNDAKANAWKDKQRGRNFERAPDPF